MNMNNYEGMNVFPKTEDRIIRYLERLETTSNVSAVLFKGIESGTSEAVPPTSASIEARVRELHNQGKAALPLEGKYWACVDDFLCGNNPEYAGIIDADKAGELGLFNPRKPIVKIYSDDICFPEK